MERCGVEARRERWRGWGGKALSGWKGQSREPASASSVNVIERMWKMRRRGSRAEQKVRACLTQNNWLEDGLIRPLNQLPSLFSLFFLTLPIFSPSLLFHLCASMALPSPSFKSLSLFYAPYFVLFFLPWKALELVDVAFSTLQSRSDSGPDLVRVHLGPVHGAVP